MEIPRFSIGNFDTRIAGSDPGEAFQTFAAEVLRLRYPQLHAYRARGRDGSIDLDTPAGVVIECKHSNGRDVQGSWTEISERLDRHLQDSVGPGQSQYAPWYATGDEAISGYVFATDAEFANKSRNSELRDEIRNFFLRIAERPHLAHLRKLNVEVLDWSDFESQLKTLPELVFRWFPSTRPTGLMPLDDMQEGSLFRAFLSEGTLPYYSRAEHFAAAGGGAASAPPEDDLLAILDRVTGLIITGKGGFGKTRLTLELGRRARQKGWLVLRTSATFREEAIDALITRLVQPTDILLLVDYVELIAAFGDRVEHIQTLNATLRHRIRYIANCRTSYYPNVQTITGHRRVDVTPVTGEPSSWLEGYRRAIVERILSQSGIEITPAYLKVCRDVPVFAVFMAYLQRQRRTDDLHELVMDGDFGTWIARRIQQSFGRPIGTELTMLLASFPMDETRRRGLSPTMGELFERMAADGWIEYITDGPDAGQWAIAHDALADRVILNHIENVGAGLRPFIQDLLDFAERNDGVASVLVALRRLTDAEILKAREWVELATERLNGSTPAWLAVRTLIQQNNLLPADEAPFVYKKWLSAGGDRMLLEEPIRRWLMHHGEAADAQFLYVAWLNAGGDRSVVEDAIRRWLMYHSEAAEARFLYVAWLDSGGDRGVVEDSIRRWLMYHSEAAEAQFLYVAWLSAGGDRLMVEEQIRRWLTYHAEAAESHFLYVAWLRAGGL